MEAGSPWSLRTMVGGSGGPTVDTMRNLGTPVRGSPEQASTAALGFSTPPPSSAAAFSASPIRASNFASILGGGATSGGSRPSVDVGGGVSLPLNCVAPFCSVETDVAGSNWHFVGEGNGGYAKVQTYNYVGVGGDWEKEVKEAHNGWRLKTCGFVILAVCIVVPTVWLCSSMFVTTEPSMPDQRDFANKVIVKLPPANDPATTSVALATEHFDCDAGLAANWTLAEQAWCCIYHRKGCIAAPQVSYDCTYGIFNWGEWSADKKQFCCKKQHIGCEPASRQTQAPPASALTQALQAALASPVAPSALTQAPQAPSASPVAPSASTQAPQAPLASPVAASASTQAPQAPSVSPVAPSASTQAPQAREIYDCSLARDTWWKSWEPAKKDWCCTRGGCTTTPAPEVEPPSRVPPPTQIPRPRVPLPYDCNYLNRWTVAKRQWCCQHARKGCPAAAAETAPRPSVAAQAPVEFFDCDIDYVDCHHCLNNRWSDRKRRWCCRHAGRGCPAEEPPPRAMTPPGVIAPPPEQAAAPEEAPQPAATLLQQPGTAASAVEPNETTAIAFEPKENSTAQLPHPQTAASSVAAISSAAFACAMGAGEGHQQLSAWSFTEREWCCKSRGLGCPAADAAAALDCAVGLEHWQHGWSALKKAWCCLHERLGCPVGGNGTSPYDCEADYTSCYHCLQQRWSAEKKAWCCQSVGRGCPTTSPAQAPDCSAGLGAWERGWSPRKKVWCCQHEGKGCQPAGLNHPLLLLK